MASAEIHNLNAADPNPALSSSPPLPPRKRHLSPSPSPTRSSSRSRSPSGRRSPRCSDGKRWRHNVLTVHARQVHPPRHRVQETARGSAPPGRSNQRREAPLQIARAPDPTLPPSPITTSLCFCRFLCRPNSRFLCPLLFSLGAAPDMEEGKRTVTTVRVRDISDLPGEREVREFFSFSGEIEQAGIRFDGVATGRTAYVTFKDPRALENALLMSIRCCSIW